MKNTKVLGIIIATVCFSAFYAYNGKMNNSIQRIEDIINKLDPNQVMPLRSEQVQIEHGTALEPPQADSFNGRAPDDPALVAYLKDHVILPPSPLPYNLTFPLRQHHSQFGQSTIVDGILKQMTGGFFLEVGANGGEWLSNSIFFERQRGWSGLLIEPEKGAFAELQSKHRKAHLVNACLSTKPTPMTVRFRPIGTLSNMGKISDNIKDRKVYPVQCYPLHSILLALGVSRIDYFSLDIEGVELMVLKTIPWDKIEVRVFDIEVNHIPEGKEAVREYMESVGYTFVKEDHIDFFFIKKSLFSKEEFDAIMNV